ncbi:MAG: efflux transporter outer membrane subunit [Deltaproteobacteria bacterium]|nr:efflux transporter outer membrane subunit [Deltaproteobacteria bacterium]
MRKMIIISALVLFTQGCMVGPDYRRPTVDMPQDWRLQEPEMRDLVDTQWWEQFDDPVLNDLIRSGLAENKDVKIAAARIEQFAGQYITTRAALFPQIGAGASFGRDRASEKGAAPLSSAVENPADSYLAQFGASWEIDLWGKLRRAKESARADILSSEEARRGVILSLVSSLATGYINLRDLDRQLEIAQATVKSREESYAIFKLRFSGGIVSELELSQVKSQYEEALATIPVIQKSIAQQENALSVLLGRNPGPIPRGKTIDQLTLPLVPAGLPSDLLARRPDICQAEQNLISANAQIGVAKAQYFPSISLTGLFGWSSTEIDRLFMGPAQTWGYAAQVAASVFTAGAIYGQVKSAEAFQQQLLIVYQQTIQNAFRDVNDALIDRKSTIEQLQAQENQVKSLENYARTARLRYDNGYTSYIEVLDAERSLFNVQLSQTQTKGFLFQSVITIYKSMGGGWITLAERQTMPSEKKEPTACP